MKPGVIISLKRHNNDVGDTSVLDNDWYREEKWKRINDWMSEIEKETHKNNQELALLQTRRIKTLLESVRNKEKYKQQSMPAHFLADIEKLNRNWDRIVHKNASNRVSLEEENIQLRREIEKLDEMKKKIYYK